jgi:glutathione synthase/RimK-type ligase-like ATP-grasp enzyme
VTSDALPHLYQDDLLLVTALDKIGIEAVPAVWSDASIDWQAFEAIVIRSPWDYFVRLEEFRNWLNARIASGARLCNSGKILEWNFDKRYLQDLASAGVSLIPTIVVSQGDSPDIVALARAKGWEDIVVKPTISGGGFRTHRFRVDDADQYRDDIAEILKDRGLLIQPFLPEIQSAGELSLLFFDGEFSHAVCKRPAPGDYRVQFQFGGTSETVEVRPEWIEGARACIEAAPDVPVYARVDGVIQDGKFLLMELEVFEPLMFLAQHPKAPARFARAIKGRLGMHRIAIETVRQKVAAIYTELVGERAQRLDGSVIAEPAMSAIGSALSEDYDEKAHDIAFHMADWNADAAFVVAVHLFPERFTPDEIAAGVGLFLVHAPNHIRAACSLTGEYVWENFPEDDEGYQTETSCHQPHT